MTGRRAARRAVATAVVAGLALALSGCTTSTDVTGRLPTQASGELPADTVAALTSATQEAITYSGASGAIVGVWAPWAGRWTSGLGTRERGGTAAMTTSLSYRSAGLTSAMTCTVLLALADKGTVALDDPVKRYLPRMVGVGDIRLEQLCNGTSGLAPLGNQVRVQFIANPQREWSEQELIGEGLAGATYTAPGAAYRASDPAVDLLGVVLETATQSSWDDLYSTYVLDPLKLTATELPDPSTDGVPSAHPGAYAHALNADGSPNCDAPADVTDLSNSVGWVASGAVSDLDETRVLTQAIAKGLLVSKSTAARQWMTVSRGDGAPTWNMQAVGAEVAGPLRGVVGMSPGSLTASYTDPTSGLTVAVMLNDSTASTDLVRNLALRLASIAAAAPATRGSAPTISLPWTEADTAAAVAAAAVCQPAAAAG